MGRSGERRGGGAREKAVLRRVRGFLQVCAVSGSLRRSSWLPCSLALGFNHRNICSFSPRRKGDAALVAVRGILICISGYDEFRCRVKSLPAAVQQRFEKELLSFRMARRCIPAVIRLPAAAASPVPR